MRTTDVINWASRFMAKAQEEISDKELKEQHKYADLVQNPTDKVLMTKMLDETSQIRDNKKLALRIRTLLKRYGTPQFFNFWEKASLSLFNSVGYSFSEISVPIFKKYLRNYTRAIIINERPDLLNKHLDERKKQNIGQNVNLLGEVVLGDGEARKRFEHYLEALKDPRINYISVKLSGIYAQINPLNYRNCKTELCELMGNLYQQAMNYPFVDENGVKSFKFVNLDMEEYKDTELTLDVFKTVLSEPRFKNLTAGIVIQAYLPDARTLQDELLDFAKKRFAAGGAHIKMRLVKGANLAMETIQSSIRGWENPILNSKVEVDANYLKVLDTALLPENAEAVHVGVASHNFFTIGYAFLLSKKNNVEEFVTFEMLEGMANHLPRVMRNLGKQVILYTPVVKDEFFLNAVSYLVRRMDENTGKDNFLTYSFDLKEGSEEWDFLKKQFEDAITIKDTIGTEPKRVQDRSKKQKPQKDIDSFKNEPDTDFDLKANQKWADEIRKKWMKSEKDKPYQIPVQIGDKQITNNNKVIFFDRSRDSSVLVCEMSTVSLGMMKEVLEIAEADKSGWRKTTLAERNALLHKAADILSDRRGDLIGVMAAVTGKTFNEGDVEVSEAVDFCRFYPYSMKKFDELKTVKNSPKGIILVIPPWNFPTAIPVGGVVAGLAGGNTVILKPATVAYPVAWEFVQAFWEAGIPKDALQIVCPEDRETLTYLSTHPSVKHVILTGGTDTAFKLLEKNPTCPLTAETGGKDAIILTASGDRDHAIQNVVKSAFGNAGQKCSACSLFVVEKSVYDDPDFKMKLKDATKSMRTGSVWDGGNLVGPMVSNTNDKLLHAINNLEDGESWLVEPEFLDDDRYILKPCVKWGVKPGNYTFETELFGPLLAVVCMDDLKHGIEIVNSSEYGLTSGLQSLDESERAYWKDNLEAGNLYINRGITGAIVQRQPFGGMKRSAFGGGIKAGGDNYVSCFVNFEETDYKESEMEVGGFIKTYSELLSDEDLARFRRAMGNYARNWKNEFSVEKVTQELVGELNTFRYLPLKNMVLRLLPNDSLCDALLCIAAGKMALTPLTVSISENDDKLVSLQKLGDDIKLKIQDDAAFLSTMKDYYRVRCCSDQLPLDYYKEAARFGTYIATAKPLVEGRVELLHYLKEQSISYEYHRYGSFSEEDGKL
ncbi:MAG: bifunctional proline dehydrogenase/L-glutamate gamma-semialdehyde dehydrogenase [Porphyromonadaceae bacterium]|jgi:RHH-type proline utilization regulon transcriptional repressor/proline dehydrogenase/delta 1-pyrroline-5-carboxylate dehydrogenase|nr:bifunctional proline dehydrogenase/L-glutamate gamma-semialdehyde dehydrogenase [Porphyromonadaceae bacterium]